MVFEGSIHKLAKGLYLASNENMELCLNIPVFPASTWRIHDLISCIFVSPYIEIKWKQFLQVYQF